MRLGTFAAGATVLAAWLLTLAVRASVGALDPVTPRFAATGGVPAPLPTLAPLVLPARDPFAADAQPLRATSAVPNGIAGLQVPDPATFTRGGSAAALGVIGVIVSASDAYALVENGAQIEVVHAGDAFAGSTVSAIARDGVTLANGVHLAVDAPRPTALASPAIGVPVPLPSAAASAQPLAPSLPPGGLLTTPVPSGPTTLGPSTVTLPGLLNGNTGPPSLFPLLSTPAPVVH